MPGIETGVTGGFVLLILLVVGIFFILYLVPIPLWIAHCQTRRQSTRSWPRHGPAW